jgi:hypothetical protein
MEITGIGTLRVDLINSKDKSDLGLNYNLYCDNRTIHISNILKQVYFSSPYKLTFKIKDVCSKKGKLCLKQNTTGEYCFHIGDICIGDILRKLIGQEIKVIIDTKVEVVTDYETVYMDS